MKNDFMVALLCIEGLSSIVTQGPGTATFATSSKMQERKLPKMQRPRKKLKMRT